MPQVVKTPDGLRPYLFHGCELAWQEGDKQAVGRCPWCGKDGKFSVEVVTSKSKCWSCGVGNDQGGTNSLTFLRILHEQSLAETTERDWQDLADHRKLLSWQTCRAWGCAKSRITGDWLVPGWDPWGKLANLYQWVERVADGKARMVLMPSPTFKHQLMGTGLPKKGGQRALICEGPWDGMAAWEVMQADPVGGHDWRDVFVCAAPTCTAFPEGWAESFKGMKVWVAFDNDHPAKQGGQSAGYSGSVRTARMLRGADAALTLRWGEQGWCPDLPSGRDVRDHLSDAGRDLAKRSAALVELVLACEPVDAAPSNGQASTASYSREPKHCESWNELVKWWRRAFRWTDGHDLTLSVMLATVLSTPLPGESQLWVIVTAPPSTGKSTLCEALSVSKHVVPKDTISTLISGYQSDAEGSENQSLAPKLHNKALVIKDADTILKDPAMAKIMSQFRALFDKAIRTSYGNKMSAAHEGISCTVLMCGTSSMYQLDSSELGARFLMCNVMEGVDDELEDEILYKIVNRADANMSSECLETGKDTDLVMAHRLTGGYLNWLLGNVGQVVDRVQFSEEAKLKCMALGRFVAYMRARPSKIQMEVVERELAGRLVEQLVRLAKCLAAVLNRSSVDAEVLRRVTQVSMDTARGSTLELCRILRSSGEEGMTAEGLAVRHNNTRDRELLLLRFLRRIGAVDHFHYEREGMTAQNRYRLSKRLARLWAQVMEDE